MPKVSVIIPTYNCAQYLPQTLESAFSQTYRDFEIIVVDDGSTDNTKGVVDAYINKYGEKIRYFYQENKGHACARNTGIKHSDGEFIAFLDADDMWLPNKLDLQIPVFYSNQNIGLVHADTCRFTDTGGVSSPNRKNFSTERISRHSGNIFSTFFCREIFISCPTVVVRKECFNRIGLFDENLAKLGFEDSDMWLRILRQYEAHYIHKPLALYRMRLNSMSKNRTKMIKAHRYVIEKLSKQYKLPDSIKKKAMDSMVREWSFGRYMFSAIFKNNIYKIKKINKKKIFIKLLKYSGFLYILQKFSNDYTLRILMYHRILNHDSDFPYYLDGITPEVFEAQMKLLSRYFSVISLEEAADRVKSGKKLPRNAVAITIDDGYSDCYLYAYPILKKHGLTATIFLTTSQVGSKEAFWVDKVGYLFKRGSPSKTIFENGLLGRIKMELPEDRLINLELVIQKLKRVSEYEKLKIIAELQRFFQVSDEELRVDYNLTWDQVREMSNGGIFFGAHTTTHPILTRIPLDIAEKEIVESKAKIEYEIGKPVFGFCYPNGTEMDFNDLVIEMLKKNGFKYAVTTLGYSNSGFCDYFKLKRLEPNFDEDMSRFEYIVSGASELLNKFRKV